MAIAFDTMNGKMGTGTINSLTNAHTTTTGSDTVLIIGVIDNTNSLTGVTVAGNAATLITSQDVGSGQFTALYYFVGASGSQNVVISRSTSSDNELAMLTLSYTGVNQTTPCPHNNKIIQTSTTPANTVDTSAAPSTDNCWHVQFVYSTGSALTASTGTTDRTGSKISAGQKMGDSNGVIHPAGVHSMAWMQSNVAVGQLDCSLAPAGAAPSTPSRRRFIRH